MGSDTNQLPKLEKYPGFFTGTGDGKSVGDQSKYTPREWLLKTIQHLYPLISYPEFSLNAEFHYCKLSCFKYYDLGKIIVTLGGSKKVIYGLFNIYDFIELNKVDFKKMSSLLGFDLCDGDLIEKQKEIDYIVVNLVKQGFVFPCEININEGIYRIFFRKSKVVQLDVKIDNGEFDFWEWRGDVQRIKSTENIEEHFFFRSDNIPFTIRWREVGGSLESKLWSEIKQILIGYFLDRNIFSKMFYLQEERSNKKEKRKTYIENMVCNPRKIGRVTKFGEFYSILRVGEFPFFENVKLIELSIVDLSLGDECSFKQLYFFCCVESPKKLLLPITGDYSVFVQALDFELEMRGRRAEGNSKKDGLCSFSKMVKGDRQLFSFLRLWGWVTGLAYIYESIEPVVVYSSLEDRYDSLRKYGEQCNYLELKDCKNKKTIKFFDFFDSDEYCQSPIPSSESFYFEHRNPQGSYLEGKNGSDGELVVDFDDVKICRWGYLRVLNLTVSIELMDDGLLKFEVLEERQVVSQTRSKSVENESDGRKSESTEDQGKVEAQNEEKKMEFSGEPPEYDVALNFNGFQFGMSSKPTPSYQKRKLHSYTHNFYSTSRNIPEIYDGGQENYAVLSADVANAVLERTGNITDIFIDEVFHFEQHCPDGDLKKIFIFRYCHFNKRFYIRSSIQAGTIIFINCRFVEGIAAESCHIKGNVRFVQCFFGFNRELPVFEESSLFVKLSPADLSVNLFNSIVEGSVDFSQCVFSGRVMASGLHVGRNLRFRGCWLGKRLKTESYHPVPFKRMEELYRLFEPTENTSNSYNQVNMNYYKNVINQEWLDENVPGISLENAVIKGDLEFVASCDEFHSSTNVEETYKILHSRGAIMGDVSYICGHIYGPAMEVGGSCYLTGLLCTGNVDFRFAKIRGDLRLFSNSAFCLHGIKYPHAYIDGYLGLKDVEIEGSAYLQYSYVNNSVLMEAAQINGHLDLHGLYTDSDLNMRRIKVNGEIKAYPNLDFNIPNGFSDQQWKYRNVKKIIKYLVPPLFVRYGIDLSGAESSKVELRGIDVNGRLEAVTGRFGQFVVGHGVKFDDGEEKYLTLKPSILKKIKIRSIKVEDDVDLSGIVLIRKVDSDDEQDANSSDYDREDYGSMLRLTHSQIGGNIRFNNENLYDNFFLLFPLFKKDSVGLKIRRIEGEESSFVDKNKSVDYTSYLPKLILKNDREGKINSFDLSMNGVNKFFISTAWEKGEKVSDIKYSVGFHSGMYPRGDDPKELDPFNDNPQAKMQHRLNLSDNVIDGRLDMRNIFVNSEISLNGTEVKRELIMSSHLFTENGYFLETGFLTRCTKMSMEQFKGRSEIDLTGVYSNITVDIDESGQKNDKDIFLKANKLICENDMLFFRPRLDSPSSFRLPSNTESGKYSTSIPKLNGGILLNGAKINLLALSSGSFKDCWMKNNLSMDHIELHEFQIDTKLYEKLEVDMSESLIQIWTFVDIEEG